MARPVCVVASGGVPYVAVTDGPPATPVTDGPPITLVESGAPPICLVNDDGTQSIMAWASAMGAIAAGDFTTDQAMWNGAYVGSHANIPGWSFSRASTGYAENEAGVLLPFASGAMRRTDKGLLVEGARTNLFLNSAVGATQNVTVAATAYTLSFRGTGTITLSGVSSAGPLVGTGANDRVTLTFTPTAGTLTLTVSGSVTNVNLEAGAFASSWIETEGSSATRAADAASIGSVTGIGYPLTLFAEFERAVNAGVPQGVLQVESASNDRMILTVSSGGAAQIYGQAGGVDTVNNTIAGALSVGTVYKHAARFATDNTQHARGGTLGTLDTSCAMASAPTSIRLGNQNGAANPLYGFLRRWALIPSALSDAQLQAITA